MRIEWSVGCRFLSICSKNSRNWLSNVFQETAGRKDISERQWQIVSHFLEISFSRIPTYMSLLCNSGVMRQSARCTVSEIFPIINWLVKF